MIDPSKPHRCPWCGKTFYTGSVADWGYKLRDHSKAGSPTVFFCSYSCISKWRKEHEK